MSREPIRAALVALCSVPLAGCLLTQSYLVELVPEVRMRSLEIRHLSADPGAPSLRLGIALVLAIRNPYSVPMPVLAHELALEVDGQTVASVPREGFVVDPGDSVDVSYPLSLQLGGAQSAVAADLLGKRVPYALRAEVFAGIPAGQLTLLGGVHPILGSLGGAVNTELSEYPLRFQHEGELRLTRLPAWEILPPRVELLGEVVEVPLDFVRGLLGPAIAGVDLFYAAGDSAEAQAALTALNAIPGVSVSAAGLEDMKDAWARFKAQDAAILVQEIDGLVVTLPVRLTNENEWAIAVPRASGAAFTSTAPNPPAVTAVQFGVDGGELAIPAGEARIVELSGSLDWSQLQGGMLSLIGGEAVSLRVAGETEFDLGYGAVHLPFDLELPDVDLTP